MHKILFVSALPNELKVVKQKVKEINTKGIKADFLVIGMGNYETIFNLTSYLENNTPDLIVNIGVCGYKEVKKDIIQVSRIKNIGNNKELIVPVFLKFADLESIACSENPVFNFDNIGEEDYVDMESYGIEFTSDKFKIPRIILKIPIDKIGKETLEFDKEKALKLLGENIDYKALLEKIILYLDGLDKKEDLSKYFEYYKMTFSEKVIFEKLYNEYKIFASSSFGEFFKENKSLDKKEFFKKLTFDSKSNKRI